MGFRSIKAPCLVIWSKSAPSEYAGIASGVNTTVSRVGSLTAVAVIGLVITLVFASQITEGDAIPLVRGQTDPVFRAASIDGFRAGMLVVVGLAIAGAVVAALAISDAEALGKRKAVSEPAPAPAES